MCPARATAGARHAPGLVMMGDILGDELRLAVCRHLLLDDRGCVRPGSHINWSQSLQSVAGEGAGVFRRSSGTRAAAAQCGAPAAQKHVFPGPRVPACIRRRRAASLRGGARGAWPHGGSRATAAGWPWERRAGRTVRTAQWPSRRVSVVSPFGLVRNIMSMPCTASRVHSKML